jgi:hypothetical protein
MVLEMPRISLIHHLQLWNPLSECREILDIETRMGDRSRPGGNLESQQSVTRQLNILLMLTYNS